MFLPDNVASFPVYSMVYSIPYFILAGVSYLIAKIGLRGKEFKKFELPVVFVFIIYTLFFGLRWFVMSDTMEYYNIYKEIEPRFSLSYIYSYVGRVEPGFLFFAMLFKSVGLGFHVFVFYNSLFDFVLLFACIKRYSINVPLTLLLFLAFNGISIELNLMRNVKAMYLFLFSIQYIRERRLKKFLLVNLVGLLFHTSAILYFPMYWLLNKKYNLRLVLIVLGVVTLIYFFYRTLLQDFFLSQIMGIDEGLSKLQAHALSSEGTVFTFGTIERIVTLGLLIIMMRHDSDQSPMFTIFLNMFFVYYILFCLFGFNQVFTDRIPNLFVPVYWFIYPYIVNHYSKRIKTFSMIILAVLFLKIYSGTHMCSAYYETVLFHDTTMYERYNLEMKVSE